MKKFINSKYFPSFLYSLCSILFLWPVMTSHGLPFKYDWSWPIFDMKIIFKSILGAGNQGLQTIFGKNLFLILGLFGFIKFPPELLLKIFLVLASTLSAYGFYLFLRTRVSSKVIAFATPIIYAFTPYIFIRTITGFTTSIGAYAALPFLLHWYFRDQDKKKWLINYLVIGFLFALVFSQAQAGILIMLFLVVDLIISIFSKQFLGRFKHFILTFASLIFFHLPWIISSLIYSDRSAIPSGGEVTTLKYIADLPHSLRNVLMLSDHQIGRDFFYALGREKLFVFGFGLFFLVMLSSVLNKKQRRLVSAFGISSILILPFTVGPTGVFSQLFSWFFSHFPILAIFRETYHFEFLLAVSWVVLFALGADWLVSFLVPRLKKISPVSISMIISSLGLFIIAPYLTFNFAGYLKLQTIPPQYSQLKSYLESTQTCQKIYYPPDLGFIYFKDDNSKDAANSDLLAENIGVPYLGFGSSILSVGTPEMFYRNHLTSEFLESKDDGSFAELFQRGGLDCLVVRTDIDTKYDQVSGLWQDPLTSVRRKWFQSDMLSLARGKEGFEEVKSFGDKIFVFKINPNFKAQMPNQIQNPNDQIGNSAIQQFSNETIQQLPLAPWASDNYDYRQGWSRGRYTFWRKNLFAGVEQDFIYTTKPDSQLNIKIDQTGRYELWARYLTGGTPGEVEYGIGNTEYRIKKDSGEEKFVWKDLGEVDVNSGDQIDIKNLSGENAIADLVLVSK